MGDSTVMEVAFTPARRDSTAHARAQLCPPARAAAFVLLDLFLLPFAVLGFCALLFGVVTAYYVASVVLFGLMLFLNFHVFLWLPRRAAVRLEARCVPEALYSRRTIRLSEDGIQVQNGVSSVRYAYWAVEKVLVRRRHVRVRFKDGTELFVPVRAFPDHFPQPFAQRLRMAAGSAYAPAPPENTPVLRYDVTPGDLAEAHGLAGSGSPKLLLALMFLAGIVTGGAGVYGLSYGEDLTVSVLLLTEAFILSFLAVLFWVRLPQLRLRRLTAMMARRAHRHGTLLLTDRAVWLTDEAVQAASPYFRAAFPFAAIMEAGPAGEQYLIRLKDGCQLCVPLRAVQQDSGFCAALQAHGLPV